MRSREHNKQLLLWGILIFLIPNGIYFILKWDPVIRDYPLGLLTIFALWWISLYLIYRYRSDRKNLRDYFIKLLNIITAKKGDDYDSSQDYENEKKRLIDELDFRIRSEDWFGNLKGYFDNKKIWKEETKKQGEEMEK